MAPSTGKHSMSYNLESPASGCLALVELDCGTGKNFAGSFSIFLKRRFRSPLSSCVDPDRCFFAPTIPQPRTSLWCNAGHEAPWGQSLERSP